MALPLLVELALGAAYREAPNGHRLAPKGIPLVWEMEESARRTGKADDRLGGSETNPKDEFGEPVLGSTAYPWGTAQTWYRSIPSHDREVHGAPAEAVLSDLAHFSQQSREGTRLYRLLRGADPELSSFVCLPGSRPSSAPSDSFQPYCPSRLGMDGTTNCRGLPVGHCFALPAA